MAIKPEIPKYPMLFKHMALAIYKSGDIKGQYPKDVFDSALNIALSRLAQYRLIAEYSTLANVVLTSAGQVRETAHRKENDRAAKTRLFDKLYEQFKAKGEKTVGSPPKTAAEQRVIDKLDAKATPSAQKAEKTSPKAMTAAAAKAQKTVPKRGEQATTKPKIVLRKRAKQPRKGYAPTAKRGPARKPRTGTVRPVKNKRPLK